MAKRRDHQAHSGSERRGRTDRRAQTGHVDSHVRPRLLLSFFACLFIPIVSIVVYRLKYLPRTDTDKDTISPLSVYDRRLVRAHTSYQEILAENSKAWENTSHRHFPSPVLAYITPWNAKGYDIAKRFTSKFTHISPVWYELKSEGSQLVLEGRHNADIGWISELRKHGNALVLPRVVLEAFPNQLLRKKKHRARAINLIVIECEAMGYDGIVLESWSRWAAYGVFANSDMRNLAMEFIKELAQGLHSASSGRNSSNLRLQLIYVIPPLHSEKLQYYDFSPDDFQALSGDVDGFSLMTYDFSGPQNPGPNAPLSWVQSCLQMLLGDVTSDDARGKAHKIFVGINFYGNDFIISEGPGGGAITGREYLSLLEKHKPEIQWKENFAEHLFFYLENSINHAVFYPSLKSISARLGEVQSWGASLSIWEIGQGLDYFFDLL